VQNETLALCEHGKPARFGCLICMKNVYLIDEKLSERIDSLEDCFDVFEKHIDKRIEKIESHFSGDYQLVASKLKPHKCPVCDGEGKKTLFHACSYVALSKLAELIDDEGRVYELCKPCKGKGIIWG
jgi:DnaJ-class molecular chaperone